MAQGPDDGWWLRPQTSVIPMGNVWGALPCPSAQICSTLLLHSALPTLYVRFPLNYIPGHAQVSHHIHCNDDAFDEDVFSAFPFLRFDDRLPRYWYHKYQHIYMVRLGRARVKQQQQQQGSPQASLEVKAGDSVKRVKLSMVTALADTECVSAYRTTTLSLLQR